MYGWKQIITKKIIRKKPKTEKKVYTYRREGLLDEMPHRKVDQSSFIVPEDNFETIINFLEEWHDKVIWKSFKVLLDEDFEEFFKDSGDKEDILAFVEKQLGCSSPKTRKAAKAFLNKYGK